MSNYKDLLNQRAVLEAQIKEAREKEVAGAVAGIRELIAEFDLKPEDIFPTTTKRTPRAGSKVEPKYRDPVSGATWTGRGKPPKWIADQDREKFAI
ncbi:H-NS histone family protein [Comamonas testosteroni]|uniref:H-NS histone family protein n=1 Tax=Comamonas testosteroni TaxID=285 RepID=A0A373F9T0_COMTE|nr:H-NS histone family protein [Comamonas testosteroni]QIZ20146.1 histone [Comamonas testosteroni]RGE40923.1 H-NS histone family protein [Comamonas testosteroni]